MPDPAVPQSVCITGANGFIGRKLSEHYRRLGAEVTGVDVVADPATGVIAGDITEPGPWQDDVAGNDLVIHTAAIVSQAAPLDAMWRCNVLGTRNVIEASRGAQRFVHFSSVVVFPDIAVPGGMTELTAVSTDGRPYIDTKVAAEQVVLQAHAAGDIRATIVRPGDVYGPGSRPWVVLPVEAIKKRQFLLPAKGKGVFTPVFVDDLVAGVALAAASPNAAGQVFTISDGTTITCAEFFGHYFRMLSLRGPITLPTGPALAIAGAASRMSSLVGGRSESNPNTVKYLSRKNGYSIEKATTVLGYRPNVALAEGMRRTEEWLRKCGYLG